MKKLIKNTIYFKKLNEQPLLIIWSLHIKQKW